MSRTYPVMTVDCGNTCTKVSVVGADGSVRTERFEASALEEIAAALEREPGSPVVYCSVGKMDARFLETLCRLREENVLILTHHTPLPLSLDYSAPERLGLDRIAAAAGALEAAPDAVSLVVDAGTAITMDVVDARARRFLGGNISAGIGLRLLALRDHTSALPEVEKEGEVPPFGHDTPTAMRSAAVLGSAAEASDAYRRARELHGCSRLLLCGGDAPLILSHLPEEVRRETIHIPGLLALGLTGIYHYNEDN